MVEETRKRQGIPEDVGSMQRQVGLGRRGRDINSGDEKVCYC